MLLIWLCFMRYVFLFALLLSLLAMLMILFQDTQEGNFGSIYIATRSVKSKHVLYIYRVVLDSVNGVSSTRMTSIAALDLQEGDIRQLQFVEDDSLMILWSHPRTSPPLPYSSDCLICTRRINLSPYAPLPTDQRQKLRHRNPTAIRH